MSLFLPRSQAYGWKLASDLRMQHRTGLLSGVHSPVRSSDRCPLIRRAGMIKRVYRLCKRHSLPAVSFQSEIPDRLRFTTFYFYFSLVVCELILCCFNESPPLFSSTVTDPVSPKTRPHGCRLDSLNLKEILQIQSKHRNPQSKEVDIISSCSIILPPPCFRDVLYFGFKALGGGAAGSSPLTRSLSPFPLRIPVLKPRRVFFPPWRSGGSPGEFLLEMRAVRAGTSLQKHSGNGRMWRDVWKQQSGQKMSLQTIDEEESSNFKTDLISGNNEKWSIYSSLFTSNMEIYSTSSTVSSVFE